MLYGSTVTLFSACSFVNTLRHGVAICHEVNCGTHLHLNFLHLLVVLSLTRCCQTTSYQHRPGWPIESLAWPVTLPWQPVSGKRWVPSWRQIQSKSLTVRACSHHFGSRERYLLQNLPTNPLPLICLLPTNTEYNS